MTKLQLVLVLNLIGWESGASFLDQSQSQGELRVKQGELSEARENGSDQVTSDFSLDRIGYESSASLLD